MTEKTPEDKAWFNLVYAVPLQDIKPNKIMKHLKRAFKLGYKKGKEEVFNKIVKHIDKCENSEGCCVYGLYYDKTKKSLGDKK